MLRICSHCRKRKRDSSFYVRKSEGNRIRTDCKDCVRARSKASHYKFTRPYNAATRLKYRSTPDGAFRLYRREAIKKGRIFELTLQYFSALVGKSCHYCRTVLDRPRIDRLNSKGGYTQDNVVPCCWTCNRMKNDLPYAEFIGQCKKIVVHMKGGENVKL